MRSLGTLLFAVLLTSTAHSQQYFGENYTALVVGTLPQSLGTQGSTRFRHLPYTGPAIVDLTLPVTGGPNDMLVINSTNAASFGIDWTSFESSMVHPFELRIETVATLPDGTNELSTNYVSRPPIASANRLFSLEVNRTYELQAAFDGWQRVRVIGGWRTVIATPEPSTLCLVAAGALGLSFARKTRRAN